MNRTIFRNLALIVMMLGLLAFLPKPLYACDASCVACQNAQSTAINNCANACFNVGCSFSCCYFGCQQEGNAWLNFCSTL
jgi:hypothetical protein